MLVYSLLPLVLALETLNEVGHWLISATGLLLIVTCLLRFTLLAGEEAIFVPNKLVLSTSPICALRLHPHLFSFASLTLQLGCQEIIPFHPHYFQRRDFAIEKLFTHVGVRD